MGSYPEDKIGGQSALCVRVPADRVDAQQDLLPVTRRPVHLRAP